MNRFFEDPLRVFLSTIATAFVICILLLFTSCTTSNDVKHAYEVVNHNTDPIIIETLHEGRIYCGVYKMTIDSSEYVVVADYEAVAIIKHK
jgi:hypothetical protein